MAAEYNLTASSTSHSTSHKERYLAVAILCVVVLALGSLFYRVLIHPHQQLNQELQHITQHYQKVSRLVSHGEQLRQQLTVWQNTFNDDQGILLTQTSFELAAAALQQRLKALVNVQASAQQRCTLQQQRNAMPKQEGVFTKVTVNLTILCRLEELQAILYDLENTRPILILDNLIVKPSRSGTLYLDISFDVSGYIRSDLSGNKVLDDGAIENNRIEKSSIERKMIESKMDSNTTEDGMLDNNDSMMSKEMM